MNWCEAFASGSFTRTPGVHVLPSSGLVATRISASSASCAAYATYSLPAASYAASKLVPVRYLLSLKMPGIGLNLKAGGQSVHVLPSSELRAHIVAPPLDAPSTRRPLVGLTMTTWQPICRRLGSLGTMRTGRSAVFPPSRATSTLHTLYAEPARKNGPPLNVLIA